MVNTLERPVQTGGGDDEPNFGEMLDALDDKKKAEDEKGKAIINAGLQDFAPKDPPEPDWEAMRAGMEADPNKFGSEAGKFVLEQGLRDLNQPPAADVDAADAPETRQSA